MRKLAGTPCWRDKHVTLAAISPPAVAQGRFVGGQQSGLAGCKPPPLFMRGASPCSSQGRCQGEPLGASPRPSAPTYLPTLACWAVCVFVCTLCLYPATPGWGVRRGHVCLALGFGCAPPLQAGVLSCVCAYVSAPLVPRHSWLGCAVWACVLGLGSQLRPATLGLVVGLSVCWCTRSAFTPPLLAGVCVMGVCAWPRVSAAPRHSWLGCWAVCVFVCTLCL